MGKRELLIIGAFIVIGLVAYQFSAPPAAEDRGFSFSRLIESMREEVRGDPGTATWVTTGTIPLSADIAELRIPSISRGVTVTGEERTDILYELSTSSNGPDDERALQYAKAVKLLHDDLGITIDLDVFYPDEASQWVSLVLKVPTRLAVRVSGRSVPAHVVDVASVDFNNVIGDVSVEGISGLVEGSHRSGRLTVERAGRVDLTLQSSRARFRSIQNGVVITARNGEAEVEESNGPIEIEQTGVSVLVRSPGGRVRIGGSGGEVRVIGPRAEVQIETRRTEVEIELTRAVPVSVITTEDTLRLVLAEDVAVLFDGAAEDGGTVQATEFDLTPEDDAGTSRLTHPFGASPSVRVVLRNSDADIVIRRSR